MSAAIQPINAALPVRRAGSISPTSRLRSGAAVQTAAGCVSALFSLEGYDRRRGVATYALRVINRTKSALVCRTWVVCKDGDVVLAYPTLFQIEPFSSSDMQVPVWPRDFASFDRAVAEIVGNGVQCIVEAAAPARSPSRRRNAAISGACVVLGLLAIAGGGVLRAWVPRITALSVAPQALSGTTVEAEYDASGAGRLSYLVTAPDGRRIAGGPLAEHAGSIFVAIPPQAATGAYSVRMAMDGPLGNASETRIINAVPSKANEASIDDISVNPMVAKPGQSVDVSYSAAADGGYVRLVGTDGTIWAQKPFSSTGQTKLVAPQLGGGQEMHVVLHVTKGGSTAQSAAGILLEDSVRPRVAAGLASAVLGDDDPDMAATDSEANGTFEVTTRAVKSGDPITVKILSPRNGMHIALNDPQSHEVAAQDVGATADLVTLEAPRVSVPTRYTVVATFTDGFGQESVVQPVTVLPNAPPP